MVFGYDGEILKCGDVICVDCFVVEFVGDGVCLNVCGRVLVEDDVIVCFDVCDFGVGFKYYVVVFVVEEMWEVFVGVFDIVDFVELRIVDMVCSYVDEYLVIVECRDFDFVDDEWLVLFDEDGGGSFYKCGGSECVGSEGDV